MGLPEKIRASLCLQEADKKGLQMSIVVENSEWRSSKSSQRRRQRRPAPSLDTEGLTRVGSRVGEPHLEDAVETGWRPGWGVDGLQTGEFLREVPHIHLAPDEGLEGGLHPARRQLCPIQTLESQWQVQAMFGA